MTTSKQEQKNEGNIAFTSVLIASMLSGSYNQMTMEQMMSHLRMPFSRFPRGVVGSYPTLAQTMPVMIGAGLSGEIKDINSALLFTVLHSYLTTYFGAQGIFLNVEKLVNAGMLKLPKGRDLGVEVVEGFQQKCIPSIFLRQPLLSAVLLANVKAAEKSDEIGYAGVLGTLLATSAISNVVTKANVTETTNYIKKGESLGLLGVFREMSKEMKTMAGKFSFMESYPKAVMLSGIQLASLVLAKEVCKEGDGGVKEIVNKIRQTVGRDSTDNVKYDPQKSFSKFKGSPESNFSNTKIVTEQENGFGKG